MTKQTKRRGRPPRTTAEPPRYLRVLVEDDLREAFEREERAHTGSTSSLVRELLTEALATRARGAEEEVTP